MVLYCSIAFMLVNIPCSRYTVQSWKKIKPVSKLKVICYVVEGFISCWIYSLGHKKVTGHIFFNWLYAKNYLNKICGALEAPYYKINVNDTDCLKKAKEFKFPFVKMEHNLFYNILNSSSYLRYLYSNLFISRLNNIQNNHV